MGSREGCGVMFRRLVLVIIPFFCQGILGDVVAGQIPELATPVTTKIDPPQRVPFGPGERLEYDVRVGFLGKRGEGFMEVGPLDSVRERTTYWVTMAYEGGLWPAKVKDHFQSWIDVSSLVTLRSVENSKQLRREVYKHWEFYPERRAWERVDNGNTGEMPTDEPLDQLSFFYFARTLPLEVGEEYVLNRYYRERGNPVILRVLRKDTVEVPAGIFPTIVVQPIIKSSGLFGEGGEAEIHFSDDERRLMVLMKSKIPIIGALSLHLRTITEGRRLKPVGRSPKEDEPRPEGLSLPLEESRPEDRPMPLEGPWPEDPPRREESGLGSPITGH